MNKSSKHNYIYINYITKVTLQLLCFKIENKCFSKMYSQNYYCSPILLHVACVPVLLQ